MKLGWTTGGVVNNVGDIRTELLESLKETRAASAALMRAIVAADATEEVMPFMPNTWDGFGKRAAEVIARAEAELRHPARAEAGR